MNELEAKLIQEITQWLSDHKSDQLRVSDEHRKAVQKLTKEINDLGTTSSAFFHHPTLRQFIKNRDVTHLNFWLLIQTYLAEKIDATQTNKNVALIDAAIETALRDAVNSFYEFKPTKREITAKALQELIPPSLIRNIYLLNDARLITLFKKYFPQPKTSLFAEHSLPPLIESDSQALIQAIYKVKNVKKQKLSEFTVDIKQIQRKFRQRQRQKQEVARLTQRYSYWNVKAEDVLKAANEPYRPHCNDTALAERIVKAAENIVLFHKVRYLTKRSALSMVFDEGLFGNLSSAYFYRDADLANRGQGSEGNSNAIILGIKQLDSWGINGKDIELVFDAEQLTEDNPNVYYQQKDLSFNEGFFQRICIGSYDFSFSHTVSPRIPRAGHTLMQWRQGEENRFAWVRDGLLTANNVEKMHQILTLNFFKFIDVLRHDDQKEDAENINKIYAAFNELDDNRLSEILAKIGAVMTQTALFNINGAHEINFTSLLTIRYKNYNLSIPALIDSLQQGDIRIWLEAKEILPEIFHSHRFMSYLLTEVQHEKAVSELQKQQKLCVTPRQIQALTTQEEIKDAAVINTASTPSQPQVQRTSLKNLLEKAAGDSRFAFLIEGTNSYYPEIIASDTLARTSNSLIFDPVCFSTQEVIHNLYKEAEKRDKDAQGPIKGKAFALVTSAYVLALAFRSSWLEIERTTKALYKLFHSQTDAEIPTWLANFQVGKWRELITYFNITSAEINAALRDFKKKLDLSNALIPSKIYTLLKENPQLTTLVGLWGELHLAAFDGYTPHMVVHNKVQQEGYRHLKLTLCGDDDDSLRKINLHLFGGAHGNLQAYQQLEKFAKEQGLISTQYNCAIGYLHRARQELSVEELEHHYFNVTWGRLALYHHHIIPLAGGAADLSSLSFAWCLLLERLYGVLQFNTWSDAWLIVNLAPASLLERINTKFKSEIKNIIMQSTILAEAQKMRLATTLDELCLDAKDETLEKDIVTFTELVSGFQLYPTQARSKEVQTSLETMLSPQANKNDPLQLIQEYAGYITASQMTFFAVKPARENVALFSSSPCTVGQRL